MGNLLNPYRFAAVAGFDPLSLSPDGLYDPSDLSTLWKDTAGTDPVTLDGDVVARIDDKSGNGNHWTQATASLRPLYKTSGGLHWLRFDGVDDWMEAPSGLLAGTVPHSIFIGVTDHETATNSLDVYLRFGGGNIGGLRDFTNELGLRVAGGNELYNGSIINGTTGVVTNILPAGHTDVSDNKCWLDGVELTVSSTSAQSMDTDDVKAWIGQGRGAATAGNPVQIDVFSLIIVAADKSADRADAESWTAERCGVTL